MKVLSRKPFLLREFWGVLALAMPILVAPYCAIPVDYLSGIPPIARYGFFGVSTWPIGCDTPSLFSERFLWSTSEVEVRYPPPPPPKKKGGISAILPRYPMKTRQMGAIPPSAILSRKGVARYGGASRTGPLRCQCARDLGRAFGTLSSRP